MIKGSPRFMLNNDSYRSFGLMVCIYSFETPLIYSLIIWFPLVMQMMVHLGSARHQQKALTFQFHQIVKPRRDLVMSFL
jgi:hypothetical protein